MPNFKYDPLEYELHALMHISNQEDVVEAYHWPNAPESLLLESGYIVSMADHRRERLRTGVGPLVVT